MFQHISNTEKRVGNTTHSGVFLTNFEVFDIECLRVFDVIYQTRDTVFHHIYTEKRVILRVIFQLSCLIITT